MAARHPTHWSCTCGSQGWSRPSWAVGVASFTWHTLSPRARSPAVHRAASPSSPRPWAGQGRGAQRIHAASVKWDLQKHYGLSLQATPTCLVWVWGWGGHTFAACTYMHVIASYIFIYFLFYFLLQFALDTLIFIYCLMGIFPCQQPYCNNHRVSHYMIIT